MPPFVLDVRKLVLDRWDLFGQILAESRFFRELQVMTQDKVDTACDQFTEAMRKAPGITLADLHKREVFDKAWSLLKQDKLRNKIYAREGAAAERFKDAVNEAKPDELYVDIWLPVARLFQEDYVGGRRKVEDALNEHSRREKGTVQITLCRHSDKVTLFQVEDNLFHVFTAPLYLLEQFFHAGPFCRVVKVVEAIVMAGPPTQPVGEPFF